MKDASHIYNVASIIERYKASKLCIVVSAIGKTTNALEQIYYAYSKEGLDLFLQMMHDIVDFHLDEASKLHVPIEGLKSEYNALVNKCSEDIEKLDKENKEAIYDQIVSLGELMSTKLITAYLSTKNVKSTWVDIRQVIKTDNRHQEGRVDLKLTHENVNDQVAPLLDGNDVLVMQGFIGSAPNGLTTTLGREGSDYSAAIMAYCLNVEALTIWKDVPGVLTADPRRFENVEKLDRMSYKEAIEMTYYGAQVIHPKTIRPLQNKSIKLHVKSYIDPDGEGTVIAHDGLLNYPPLVVIQDDMILVHIASKDFSFIAENHLSQIFKVLNDNRIKLGTMRNSAISFTICVKNPGKEKLNKLIEDLGESFTLDVYKNLQLMTVRYFNKQLIEGLTRNKVILFEERMKYTIQLVVRQSLELIEKKEEGVE